MLLSSYYLRCAGKDHRDRFVSSKAGAGLFNPGSVRLRNKFFLFALVLFFTAADATSVLAVDAPPSAKSDNVTFPYYAVAASGNVNIRSGGSTAYYSCGKLRAGQKVTVVGEEFNWSKILPPPGSFSWISKKYVKVSPSNPKLGIVTGDKVHVWVGSPLLGALTSSSPQVKLSSKKSDTVQLLGEEDEGYLKITPPRDAYLYVRSEHLKNIGPAEVKKSLPVKTSAVKPVKPLKEPILKPIKKAPVIEKTPVQEIKMPEPSISKSPLEMKLLIQCRKLARSIEAETQKKLADQDYNSFKKEIADIIAAEGSGKAKAYAEYLKDQIARFELATSIDSELKTHSQALNAAKKDIKDTHADQIAKVRDPGKFIVKGILKPSNIFNAKSGIKRYRICQDNGKTICYAEASSRLPESLLKKYFNKKVALVGKTQSNFFSSVGLVKFTDIVPADALAEQQ